MIWFQSMMLLYIFLMMSFLLQHTTDRPVGGGWGGWGVSKLSWSCERYYGLLLNLIASYYHLLFRNHVQTVTKVTILIFYL